LGQQQDHSHRLPKINVFTAPAAVCDAPPASPEAWTVAVVTVL
jgi:hypothetical protein